MAPHKRLLAWKECHQLVLSVYQLTDNWPKHELYGLTSQTRRAAFSAAVNIVEGAARKGVKEFKRFLSISLASLAELEYALEVATELGYVEPAMFEVIAVQQRRARAMTWRLQHALSQPSGDLRRPAPSSGA
jgi:four helix bundle protein